MLSFALSLWRLFLLWLTCFCLIYLSLFHALIFFLVFSLFTSLYLLIIFVNFPNLSVSFFFICSLSLLVLFSLFINIIRFSYFLFVLLSFLFNLLHLVLLNVISFLSTAIPHLVFKVLLIKYTFLLSFCIFFINFFACVHFFHSTSCFLPLFTMLSDLTTYISRGYLILHFQTTVKIVSNISLSYVILLKQPQSFRKPSLP